MMFSVRSLSTTLLAVSLSAACTSGDGSEPIRSQVAGETTYENGVDDTIRVDPVLGLEVRIIEPAEAEAETEATTALEVAIAFERSDEAVGPRIAEMFLDHSENLHFLEAQAGAAAIAAGKTVIGQPKSNERVRVIVFSAGAEELGTGHLATVRFSGIGDGPFAIQLASDNQIFAPVEANGNLLVGDAVVID